MAPPSLFTGFTGVLGYIIDDNHIQCFDIWMQRNHIQARIRSP